MAPVTSAKTRSPGLHRTLPTTTGAAYRTRWYGPGAGATPVDQTGIPASRTRCGFWMPTLETTPTTPSLRIVRACMLPKPAARGPPRGSTSCITATLGPGVASSHS
jgi:hypothetical protein